MGLLRIELSYAVFGIIVTDGVVVETAPIGHWMVGKSVFDIVSWVDRNGGSIEWVC